MRLKELWIDKTNLRNTRAIDAEQPDLDDGDIRVAIDKFAITSNNVGYAFAGDLIGYWRFFPTAESPWGKVTVRGMADVVESQSAEIGVGERLYGFFPMSSHVMLTPGRVKEAYFIDETPHRYELPALYNQYSRTQSEPKALRAMEDVRCLFLPLFVTGFVIADFLQDNTWFGATQILIGSASSKTGYSLAKFVRSNGYRGKLIGLTAERNRAFVQTISLYDDVVTYDNVENLDRLPAVYVDMAGDGPLRVRLHRHLGSNMRNSQIVGVTHWYAQQVDETLPGSPPTFFFAPTQIEKRNADWGPGVLTEKAHAASAALAAQLQSQLVMESHRGVDACARVWRDMLDNKISGQQGIMISLQDAVV